MIDWLRARTLTLAAIATIALGVVLAGCEARQLAHPATVADAVGAPPPAVIADRTTLDERRALQAEQLYQATARVILGAVDRGLIPARIKPAIAAADRRAYQAVGVVRVAYRTGNATSYTAAADEADKAVDALIEAFRG